LFGTIGSGLIYTYVGDEVNSYSGNDAVTGLAACFLAGTVSSLIAALVTTRIDDHKAGLQCGSCWTVVAPESIEEDVDIYVVDDTDHGDNAVEAPRTEI
jgi:hypothetical protein